MPFSLLLLTHLILLTVLRGKSYYFSAAYEKAEAQRLSLWSEVSQLAVSADPAAHSMPLATVKKRCDFIVQMGGSEVIIRYNYALG